MRYGPSKTILIAVIAAAIAPLILEGIWALYLLGNYRSPSIRWTPIFFEYGLSISTILGLMAWARWSPETYIRAVNSIGWVALGSLSRAQKMATWGLVAVSGFAFLIHLLQIGIGKCAESTVWYWAAICYFDNHVMSFWFLGSHFDAIKILMIELAGLILGMFAGWIYGFWLPPVLFDPPRKELAETLAEWPHGIPRAHIVNTLDFVVREESNSSKWNPQDRDLAQERVKEIVDDFNKDDFEFGVMAVIRLLPLEVQARLTRLFFDPLFPMKRWVLFLSFLVAGAFVLFPIVVRVLLVYFNRLEDKLW
ncbi:hypothetical protein [Variovorax rhizosphaerae]|uniref:Uncharacterized protein n=1 Tax=Variovorax rhizosphaerae TaxID=1836200 RepID=A0ABU8WFS2_9BURK